MTERRIPYEYHDKHSPSEAKRWTRKLAERGKLTAKSVKIPDYGKLKREQPYR